MKRATKNHDPIVIGLTGSIGMGKSTVARLFAGCGAVVLDSDEVVHGLLAPGGAAAGKVAEIFPEALREGVIDRALLGSRVFGDAKKMRALERLLHPLVRRAQEECIKRAREAGKRFVVLDIPLLFETHGEKRCDVTVVADAPADMQRRRVLARKGMTRAKFERILRMQMPAADKRARADFIVPTGEGMQASERAVKHILMHLCETSATIRP